MMANSKEDRAIPYNGMGINTHKIVELFETSWYKRVVYKTILTVTGKKDINFDMEKTLQPVISTASKAIKNIGLIIMFLYEITSESSLSSKLRFASVIALAFDVGMDTVEKCLYALISVLTKGIRSHCGVSKPQAQYFGVSFKELVDDYKFERCSEESIHNIFKFLVSVISIALGITIVKNIAFSKGFTKEVIQVAGCVRAIGGISKLIQYMIETSMKYVFYFAGVPYIDSVETIVSHDAVKWMEESTNLMLKLDMNGVNAAAAAPEFLKHLGVGDKLLERMTRMQVPASVLTPFMSRYRMAKDMKSKAQALVKSGTFREPPLVILLYGGSGVGKTTLQNFLAKLLMQKMGYIDFQEERDIHYRVYENEYWDGYTNQSVVVIDDFLQSKISTDASAQLNSLIRMNNIAPSLMHMASVEDKKDTYFTSKLVILSSNVDVTDPNTTMAVIHDHQAVLRRLDLVAGVDIFDEYKTASGVLDRTKVPMGWSDKVYVMTIGEKKLNFSAFVETAFAVWQDKKDQAARIVADLPNYIAPTQQPVVYGETRELTSADYLRINQEGQDFYSRRYNIATPNQQIVVDQNTGCSSQSGISENVDRTAMSRVTGVNSKDGVRWLYDPRPDEVQGKEEDYNSYFSGTSLMNRMLDQIGETELPLSLIHELGVNSEDFETRVVTGVGRPMAQLSYEEMQQFSTPEQSQPQSSVSSERSSVSNEDTTFTDWTTSLSELAYKYGVSDDIQEGDSRDATFTDENGKKIRVTRFVGEVVDESTSEEERDECMSLSAWIAKCKKECADVLDMIPNAILTEDETGTTVWPNCAKVVYSAARTRYLELKAKYTCAKDQMTRSFLIYKEQLCEKYPWITWAMAALGVSGVLIGVYSILPESKREDAQSGDERTSHFRNRRLDVRKRGQAIKWYSGKHVPGISRPIAHITAYDKQAEEIIFHRIRNNVVRVCLCDEIGGNTKIKVHGIFICTTILMIPHHFFLVFANHDRKIRITCMNGEEIVVRPLECALVQAEELDVMFLKLPPKYGNRSSIISLFQTNNDVDRVKVEAACLVTCSNIIEKEMIIKTAINLRRVGSYDYDLSCAGTPNDEDGLDTRCEIDGAYVYRSTTGPGDCGALLVAICPSKNRKLMGIHVAGNEQQSASVVLTQEKISHYLKHFDKIEPIILDEEVEYDLPDERIIKKLDLQDTNLEFVGTQPKEVKYENHIRSDIIKSPLMGVLPWKNMTLPAVVNVKHELCPLGKGIKKQDVGQIMFDDEKVSDVAQDLYDHMMLLRKDYEQEPRVLTIEEAINGVRGDSLIKAMNLHTSPGLPYVRMKNRVNSGGKFWLLLDSLNDENKCIYEPTELLSKEIKDRYEKAISNPPIIKSTEFIDILKDERRPIEKVLEGKTRVFNVAPFDLNIMVRQYFGSFVAQVVANPILSECSVGINVHGPQWGELYDVLNGFDKRGEDKGKWFAGDFSNYDKTLPYQLSLAVLDIINRWYQGKKNDHQIDEDTQVRKVLWQTMFNAKHVAEGLVYRVRQGNPSGIPLTTIVNSLVNSLLIRLMWREVMDIHGFGSMAMFNRCVITKNFGDDNVVVVHARIADRFNMKTVSEAFQKFGIEYTMADKMSFITPFEEKKDITYLKRRFEWRPVGVFGVNYCFAPLPKEVVQEMVLWQRKSPESDDDTMQAIFDSALREAAHIGRDFFKYFVKEIQIASQKVGLIMKPTLYSFEEQRLVTVIFGDDSGDCSRMKAEVGISDNIDEEYSDNKQEVITNLRLFDSIDDVSYEERKKRYINKWKNMTYLFARGIDDIKIELENPYNPIKIMWGGLVSNNILDLEEIEPIHAKIRMNCRLCSTTFNRPVLMPANLIDYRINAIGIEKVGRDGEEHYTDERMCMVSLVNLRNGVRVLIVVGGCECDVSIKVREVSYIYIGQEAMFQGNGVRFIDNNVDALSHLFAMPIRTTLGGYDYNFLSRYNVLREEGDTPSIHCSLSLWVRPYDIESKAYYTRRPVAQMEVDSHVEAPPKQEGLIAFAQDEIMTKEEEHEQPLIPIVQQKRSLEDWIGQLLPIGRIRWKPSYGVGERLAELIFPHVIISFAHIFEKMKTYYMFRSGIRLVFKMNGTRMHYGKLVAAWYPGELVYHGNDMIDRDNVIAATGFRHILIAPNDVTGHEMVMDYNIPDTFVRVAEPKAFGSLVVYVLNPLTGVGLDAPSDVFLSIFAQMVDIELEGFTSAEQKLTIVNPTVAKGPKVADIHVKAEVGNLVEDVARVVSDVVPKPIGAIASTVAKHVLSADKPLDQANIGKMRIAPPELTYSKCNDQSMNLACSSSSRVGSLREVLGGEHSSMGIKDICQKPMLLTTVIWKATHTMGTVLCRLPVHPLVCLSTVSGTIFPTYLSYVASTFQYWRGSLRYFIQVTCSEFHSGRIRIYWDKVLLKSGDIASLKYGSISRIIDIRDETSTGVIVPYMSQHIYNFVGRFSSEQPKDTNGYLYIDVVNELLSPQPPYNDVYINIYVSAGADFSLKMPLLDRVSSYRPIREADDKMVPGVEGVRRIRVNAQMEYCSHVKNVDIESAVETIYGISDDKQDEEEEGEIPDCSLTIMEKIVIFFLVMFRFVKCLCKRRKRTQAQLLTISDIENTNYFPMYPAMGSVLDSTIVGEEVFSVEDLMRRCCFYTVIEDNVPVVLSPFRSVSSIVYGDQYCSSYMEFFRDLYMYSRGGVGYKIILRDCKDRMVYTTLVRYNGSKYDVQELERDWHPVKLMGHGCCISMGSENFCHEFVIPYMSSKIAMDNIRSKDISVRRDEGPSAVVMVEHLKGEKVRHVIGHYASDDFELLGLRPPAKIILEQGMDLHHLSSSYMPPRQKNSNMVDVEYNGWVFSHVKAFTYWSGVTRDTFDPPALKAEMEVNPNNPENEEFTFYDRAYSERPKIGYQETDRNCYVDVCEGMKKAVDQCKYLSDNKLALKSCEIKKKYDLSESEVKDLCNVGRELSIPCVGREIPCLLDKIQRVFDEVGQDMRDIVDARMHHILNDNLRKYDIQMVSMDMVDQVMNKVQDCWTHVKTWRNNANMCYCSVKSMVQAQCDALLESVAVVTCSRDCIRNLRLYCNVFLLDKIKHLTRQCED